MKKKIALITILIPFYFILSVAAIPNPNDVSREKLLLDYGWKFCLSRDLTSKDDFFEPSPGGSEWGAFSKSGGAVGAMTIDYADTAWRQVDLPHDWAVELDFIKDNSNPQQGSKRIGYNFPETSIGWYRKTFTLPETDNQKRISIKFDGVFRNSMIWLNGFYLGNNLSGYSEFSYDVTDFVNYGEKNVLVVRVDARVNEGWFYEGAGIYRHAWLIKNSPLHIPDYGTYITTSVDKNMAKVDVKTEIFNQDHSTADCSLELKVVDQEGKTINTIGVPVKLAKAEKKTINLQIPLARPRLWSIGNPYLYKLVSTIKSGKKIIDQTENNFGIRTIYFDKDKGLFLNGEHVKIKGTSNHQDHAGVGAALPDALQDYRIMRLKEMGCNAYRTSHNPPTNELLDACDRLGMLVFDETRLLNSSPEYLNQFERLILRDRNHPSVILWSIGNEECFIQNEESGKRIALTFKELQEKLDPSRLCSYGGNNGNTFEGVNSVLAIRGFNYMGISDIDQYRKDHPGQILFGSEEAATLCTRGQYTIDPELGFMSDYDKEENAIYSWCATAEKWWKFYDERSWLVGAFAWTGFDYRGEPAPYVWPCVNSHFGIMDVCGFPKNNYYYYQSWWTEKDVLHLFPHWNWQVDDTINVWSFTNCSEVELFLNGESQGKRTVEKDSHVEWNIVYKPGELKAIGTRNGRVITTSIETVGVPQQLVAVPDRESISANGEDVCVVNISVVDEKGREVPYAGNLVKFDIKGDGKIIGVGNGNPSSHEADKIIDGKYYRSLFNGKCQVIIQSTKQAGEIKFKADSDRLKACSLNIRTVLAPIRPFIE